MTWLAEIAARSASRTRTVSHWDGQSLTTVIENVEPVVEADADEQEADEERRTIRAELFAAPHLMAANGSTVHYGTPERFGNTDLPMCRASHGYHRISYYQAVDLPVTCANCTSRYGSEA